MSETAQLAPRFAQLAKLDSAADSSARRELLRQVTEALDTPGEAGIAEFDQALAAAACDYSEVGARRDRADRGGRQRPQARGGRLRL